MGLLPGSAVDEIDPDEEAAPSAPPPEAQPPPAMRSVPPLLSSAPPPPAAPRAMPRRPGASLDPANRAADCLRLCLGLQPGHVLLVERVSGQGGRAFLASIDCEGAMAFPLGLAQALAREGHRCQGELSLTVADSSGVVVAQAITPSLNVTAGGEPVVQPTPGAPPPPIAHAGVAPDPAAMLESMSRSLGHLASALRPAAQPGNTSDPGLRQELAARDATIAELRARLDALETRGALGGTSSSDSDDDEEDDDAPPRAVSQTVATINALNSAGLVKAGGEAAAAAAPAVAAGDGALMSLLGSAVPGFLDLLRQCAHEIGQYKRMVLAIDAAMKGIKVEALGEGGQAAGGGGMPEGGPPK